MTTALYPQTIPAQAQDDDALTPLADLFKALGDPLRLQILRVLKDDSYSVSELCEVFDLRQSALSHHLKVLVTVDLLVRRREGTVMFYRRQLPTPNTEALLGPIMATIDHTALSTALAEAVANIQRQRECNSRAFFENNVARFKVQKELIASHDDYADATLHFIDRLSDTPLRSILEIGPGDGALLPALSDRAQQVTALDTSATMLGTAKSYCHACPNIAYVHGDTQAPSLQGRHFDIIIANMVLHHTPHPEQLIAEAAALLRSGGGLIISELCAHDQAWAREHCGDLWLGFDTKQLDRWCGDAGLQCQAEVFIAQRNGFRVQVKLFQLAAS